MAATVAPEQPLEPVVVVTLPGAVAAAQGEDALDAFVGLLGDERWVPAAVFLVVVGDEAAVWKEGTRTATDATNPEAGSAPLASSTTQAAAPVTTTIPPTTTVRAKAATVAPPAAAPVEPSTQYLADLKAVSGTFKTGTSTIGGNKAECGKSLLFSLNTFSSHRSAVFNIAPGATTFAAKLGLDNGTRNGVKAHFQIYLDGSPINTGYILDTLSVEDVNISVSGKSRIGLTTDGTENGGGTAYVGDATWCDARLTK